MLRKTFVLPIAEDDSTPSSLLLEFYKSLGWDNKKQNLDPHKIKISEKNYHKLYDLLKSKCENGEIAELGFFYVNYAPSVDDSIGDKEVILERGAIA